jgi:hypothetical protein
MRRMYYYGAMVMALFMVACGGDDSPSDPCAVPIVISVETSNSEADSPTGSATISATGGNAGKTYALNSGTAQSSNVFNNLAAGAYTVAVVDAEGCTSSMAFNVDEILVASFASDIAPIIQSRCATSGCHVAGGVAPFTLNNYAEISPRAARIKVRTQAGTMPPSGRPGLSQLQVDLIAAWVDAGAMDN